MADNAVTFRIELDGNKAVTGVVVVDDTFKKLNATVKTTTSSIEKFGGLSLKFNMITDSIGKITQGFRDLVGGALDFERTQTNMTTLFKGNKEAADAMLDNIREYAKLTSYDTSGLAKAQQTMMSFGLDADFAFGKLKNIGDIAMGDKQKMQSLALAFAQATSTGKLMGQDLLQMINQGFNPLQVISDKTGLSMDILKDKMSKGAISAKMVAQAFEWATEEGSQFYNGAINSGDTVAGKIDKIKENIDNMKISLFNATGGATAYIAAMGEELAVLANLVPVLGLVWKGIAALVSIKWADIAATVKSTAVNIINSNAIRAAAIEYAMMKREIAGTSAIMNLGFIKNTIRATWAVVQFATVGIFNLLKSLVLLPFSLAASGTAFTAFATTASVACKAVTVAIGSIPIIGWIAIAITAIVALGAYLWKTFAGFRAVMMTVWDTLKGFGNMIKTFVLDRIRGIISGLGAMGSAIAKLFKGDFSGAFDDAKKGLRDLSGYDAAKNAFGNTKEVVSAVRGNYQKHLAEETAKQEAKKAAKASGNTSVIPDGSRTLDPSSLLMKKEILAGGTAGKNAGSSAGQVKAVNINISNMIGTWNAASGYSESKNDVEDKLAESLARILGMAETAA